MNTTPTKPYTLAPHCEETFDPAAAARLTGFSRLFWKIDRILAGVAGAEAGNLDALHQIRIQDQAVVRLRQSNPGGAQPALDPGLVDAKAI